MNFYVDIHANFLPELPGLGTGILSTEDARERVILLRDSRLKVATAAPAFRPALHAPAEFLEMRNQQLAAMQETAQPMRLLKGAVVPFSYCENHISLLRDFCMEGTDYLLVDFSDEPVNELLCERIFRVQIDSRIWLVAADVDRYFNRWTLEDWTLLRQIELLMQISVDGLLEMEHRRLALYLLANGYVHFIASGGQRISEPLGIMEALRLVQRSLPAEMYKRIKYNPTMLISHAAAGEFFVR